MPTAEATRRAWISGAILGLLILISLWGIGDYSFLAGLFLGIVGAVITALVLIWMSLGGEGMDAAQWEPDALSGTGQAAAQTLDVIEPQPSPKPAVQETAQEISDLKAKSVEAPAKPVDKAEPDDLKLIKGVGPKLEELLLENGVTQFRRLRHGMMRRWTISPKCWGAWAVGSAAMIGSRRHRRLPVAAKPSFPPGSRKAKSIDGRTATRSGCRADAPCRRRDCGDDGDLAAGPVSGPRI